MSGCRGNVCRGWATGTMAAGLMALLVVAPAGAQTAPPAAPPSQWTTAVTNAQSGGGGLTLDDKQVAALRAVSKFFTDSKQLKGNFAQTDPDGKKKRGRFSMKQPGKFRFDYGFGLKLVVVSDGNMLAIQDLDIGSDDRIELDRTPFRMLLRRDVDLMRDARVYEVQEVDDLIIVALGDKSPDAPGKIRLFFTKKPTLELKEWVTTDGQGADTRVEVGELSRTEDLDDNLYKVQAPAMKKN
jgi:outer membrane lipoprotein-sorting protein